MSKLTGTHSEVSAIDFTTLTTVPGTLKVHGAPIQILDLRKFYYWLYYYRLEWQRVSAGIIEGANDGRGRGRQGAWIILTVSAVRLIVLKLLPVGVPYNLSPQ